MHLFLTSFHLRQIGRWVIRHQVLFQSWENGTCSKTIGNLKLFPLLVPKLFLRSLPDLRSGIWRVYENTLLSIPERLFALFLMNIPMSLGLGFLQPIKFFRLICKENNFIHCKLPVHLRPVGLPMNSINNTAIMMPCNIGC